MKWMVNCSVVNPDPVVSGMFSSGSRSGINSFGPGSRQK